MPLDDETATRLWFKKDGQRIEQKMLADARGEALERILHDPDLRRLLAERGWLRSARFAICLTGDHVVETHLGLGHLWCSKCGARLQPDATVSQGIYVLEDPEWDRRP